MRTRWIAVGLAASACEPPDPIGEVGEPAIAILHPAADVGTIPMVQTPEGLVLDVLLVVDIDGFEFVEPNTVLEDVEGEGHYHFFVNESYLGPPPQQFIRYVSEPDEWEVGQQMALRVELATHTHILLGTPDSVAQIEFTAGEAEAE